MGSTLVNYPAAIVSNWNADFVWRDNGSFPVRRVPGQVASSDRSAPHRFLRLFSLQRIFLLTSSDKRICPEPFRQLCERNLRIEPAGIFRNAVDGLRRVVAN